MLRGDLFMMPDAHREDWGVPRDQPGWFAPAVAGVPLFHGVSKRHLRRIVHLVKLREYGTGARVVRVGTRGENIHIVLDGEAHVVLVNDEETILRPGDCFGELALIDGAPRAATVTATKALTTGCIARADFRRLLRDEPAVAVGLLPGLVRIIRQLEGDDPAGSAARAARRAPIGKVPAGPGTAVEGRDLLGWMMALRHVPLFAPLSESHLRRVAKLFAVRKYRDGGVIVREGDPGDSFCALLGGKARVEREGIKPYELESGQWFGELALIDGAPRAATIRAHYETTVARMPRSAFQKLLKDEPRIALGLASSLVAVIRDLQKQ